MNTSQIYCSSGAFADAVDVSSVLDRCRKLGIHRVEFSSGLKSGVNDLAKALKEAASEFNIIIHNYFPAPKKSFVLNLAEEDHQKRHRSIRFCESAIRLSADAGAPVYSVHAGFVSNLEVNDLGKPERQIEQVTEKQVLAAAERFRESIELLLEVAEDSGVDLLVENNVHATPRSERSSRPSHLLLADPESTTEFFLRLDHPRLGLLLDVAHWRVSATHLEFDHVSGLEAISPWVRLLHLSENDGQRDSNQICRDDSWFWEPLSQHLNLSKTPAVLEAYDLSDEQIRQQLDLIAAKMCPLVHN